MRWILLLAASASIAGCTTTRDVVRADMRGGLDALIGHPVDAAIARFGEPDGSIKSGDLTVYDWNRGFSGTAVTTSRAYGFASSETPTGGPVFETVSRRQVDLSCGVRLVASEDGLIMGWHYEGNLGACKSYAGDMAQL